MAPSDSKTPFLLTPPVAPAEVVGSQKAGLAMAFKLLLAAEHRWRRVNAPHLVALLKAGVKFPNGQGQMCQSQQPDDEFLFSLAPSLLTASEVLIRKI